MYNGKRRSLRSVLCRQAAALLLLLSAVYPLSGQTETRNGPDVFFSGAAADFPQPVSGEFAFFRDYTFLEPTWIGILFYDTETWAARILTPGTGRRFTVFFTAEIHDGKMRLTGQRNDPNLQQEDVPLVNYLMQLLPFLWDERARAGNGGVSLPQSGIRGSFLPPTIRLESGTPFFGGKCTLTFAPEIPVFGLESIDDAGSRRIFQFESGGCISAESSTAFFDFAPVPQNARAAVREGNPAADGRDGGSAGTDGLLEPLVTVAPNFFLAGENASIVTGRGQTGGKSARPFFATLAKFFLLSEDVSVVPFPSSFSMEKHGNVFQLDQILWLREENEAVCKRMLVLPDFAAGEYRFAVISGFPQVFAGKQEELNRLALSLLEESVPEAEN